jgi:hypothetical protein
LLFIQNQFDAADTIEVFVDGASLGKVEMKRNGGVRLGRVVFTSGEKTHFLFEIGKADKIVYRPEFDLSTKAGDLVDVSFKAADKKPPYFETGPTHDFPALVEGVPLRVWCWFGPANRKTEFIDVQLVDAKAARAFKALAAEKHYTVKEHKWDLLRVEPPKGVTIVETVLDVETWAGVKQVYFEVARFD